ncbi:MAG: ATP-binding cassette domain-containing protein, partial [Halobacteriovoraceae bacterium]|nr:ATP-binding cassette domain-containing protein [Halobacteriovoraceae bacterium]
MQALITLNNLTARYDARKTDGVSSLSLTIKSKEILALVGPSGSGKTTTLKVIANMLPYQSGHIDYHDKYELAYVDQFQKLDPKKSVFENLEMELIDLIEEPEKRANQIRSILGLLEITNEINSLCS